MAIGVDALSVSPRTIPELEQALASVHLKRLRLAADGIMACRTATEAELALRACLGEQGEPGDHLLGAKRVRRHHEKGTSASHEIARAIENDAVAANPPAKTSA